MEIYIIKNTQQKNKAIFSELEDSRISQVSVAALRLWSMLGPILLTIDGHK